MTTYAPGTPSWVDLASTDVEASKRFYSELFGWDTRVAEEPEAMGYTTFLKGGKAVAAVGGQMDPSLPTTWTTYFATNNVDDTVSKVEAAGGKVLMPPLDVMGYGKMAVFADSGGAAFAVWQEGTMPGAELRDESGSFGWAELMTGDPGAAKTFYPSALGVSARDVDYVEGVYTLWEVGGQAVAGHVPGHRGRAAALDGLLQRRRPRRHGGEGRTIGGHRRRAAHRHPCRPIRRHRRPTGRVLLPDQARPRLPAVASQSLGNMAGGNRAAVRHVAG